MTPMEFQLIVDKRTKQIDKLLYIKAKEYSFKDDRLHNFKQAARMNNTTQAKALWGIATKHLVSVKDLVNGDLSNTKEIVGEKVGDMINYLILLEAIFAEERSKRS